MKVTKQLMLDTSGSDCYGWIVMGLCAVQCCIRDAQGSDGRAGEGGHGAEDPGSRGREEGTRTTGIVTSCMEGSEH